MSSLKVLIFIALVFLQSLALADTSGPCSPTEFLPPNLSAHLDQICKVAIKSEICQEVSADDLMKCDEVQISKTQSIWSVIKGCGIGAFESVADIAKFIWSVMKWSWSNATSSESRTSTSESVSEYSQVAKLYLHTEYAKAYSKSTEPFRKLEAAEKMGGVISQLLLNTINEAISKKIEQYSCLNSQAKSEAICKLAGDIFLPPTGALALLKYGPKVLEMSKITSLFKKAKVLKPKYRTVNMKVGYIDEQKGRVFGTKVKYLTEAEKDKLKVIVNAEGKLVDRKGKLVNFDKAIYVMDKYGQIFVSTEHEVGKFHHTSILGGQAVAGAGEISVVNGVLKYIDRHSGHYRPPPEVYKQVIEELKSQGVKIEEGVVKNRGY